ncbi:DUF4336 domain-containing protein [Sphingomonas sanguinis]|uniref:DUF4336 domain-containing protein n=1 Tax=Sphingomonas sp. LC-1 TaxID=3110957 RepID=UPI0021BAF669|nr:DUF4336 domain-containing protein [Sphingomonas sp. LC-1]MCT8003389.1 DUF4336 domain-containing protein [Sphingomonas sp. LC-1]
MTQDRQAWSGRGKLLLGAAIGTGTAGIWWLMRGAASDASAIAYPPVDMPKRLADNVWIVDSGPISAMGMKLPIRMTILRLGDGGLLLHSPTPYSPALGQAVEALGPIKHLVAPTVAHWMFLKDWQKAYPEATNWAVPALRHRPAVRKAGVRIDTDLGDEAPQAWGDSIRQGLVRGGGGFEEACFLHSESRTLVLADLVENLEPSKLPPVTAAVMRATLATNGTTGLHVRAAIRLGGRQAKEAVTALLATDPARVVFAHGAIFAAHGAARLRRAFAWLV